MMFDEVLPPQKMLDHFRHESMEQQAREASTSLRRWWWEYLRLSKDYWFLCRTCPEDKPETYDKMLAQVFKDFGNVHEGTFEEWWVRKGSSAFAEQQLPPRVERLTPIDGVITGDWSGRVVIQIPLQLTRETVQKQVLEILDEITGRPARQIKVSTSRYPSSMIMPRVETLQKELDAYCLYRLLVARPKALAKIQVDEEDRQTQEELFRVGVLSGLNQTYATLRGPEEQINKRKRYMRSLVSTTVLKVAKTIANVEIGRFPTDAEIEDPKVRFTSKQDAVLAKMEEEWWSLDLYSGMSKERFQRIKG
jgi:hypothetical protein